MVLGGIPHYLEKVKANISATQNIARLCFARDGQLSGEFNKLFTSLFNKAEAYVELINIIASKRNGMARKAIVTKAKLTEAGGTLTERLTALEEAGFIRSFVPIGYTEKGLYYKLIDEYCLFYLTWIKPVQRQIKTEIKPNYWTSKVNSHAWKSWAGYAFESVCLKHIAQIRQALFVPDGALAGSWNYRATTEEHYKGAQIDLLFDRDDGVITICEIKYNQKPFEIDKKYAAVLQGKIDVFMRQTKTCKQIFLAMITADGLKKNKYSEMIVRGKVKLADLFKSI